MTLERESGEVEKRKPARKHWGDPGSCVKRRTEARVFSRGARPVVVAIYPDGVIGLRLLGQRKEEYIDAASAYREAVVARVAIERAKRKAARKTVRRA